MLGFGTGTWVREFHEYNVKPAWDLLVQGEFAFLAGALVEDLVGRNPYFWYRERHDKDSTITRTVRNRQMQLKLYDRGISRHLFIRGIHEAQATAAYRDTLAELAAAVDGDLTALEVGGNIGYYVLETADVLGERVSIYAFEPDSQNRSLLETNVALNTYEQLVEIVPQAVDDTSGEATFYRSTHSNWNRLRDTRKSEREDELVTQFPVETTSVDDFLARRDIEPGAVNTLRMDLEGHELSVLHGMEKVLAAGGPLVLFVEFHPKFVSQSEYERALVTLEKQGFDIRFVNQRWDVLDVDSFEALRRIRGSHVRVVFSRDL